MLTLAGSKVDAGRGPAMLMRRRQHAGDAAQSNLSALMSISESTILSRIYLVPGAVLIAGAFPAWYGLQPTWSPLPSIVLAGFGLYQLNRVYDLVEDKVNDPRGYLRVAATRQAVRCSAIAALVMSLLISMLLMNASATFTLSLMLLLGTFYSVPLMWRAGARPYRLKETVSVKNAIPAVVWSVTTVLYPAVGHAGVDVLRLVLAMAALACIVLTIEVAWDVRDTAGDLVAGIKTLPTRIGAGQALLIPTGLSGVLAVVICLLIYWRALSLQWLLPAFLLVLLPGVALLWRHALAGNRRRGHLLVVLNMLTLLPVYFVGRWA